MGLSIGEDGQVNAPFSKQLWLTEVADEITELYVIYLIESGRNAVIASVKPAGTQATAPFEGHEGFLIR